MSRFVFLDSVNIARHIISIDFCDQSGEYVFGQHVIRKNSRELHQIAHNKSDLYFIWRNAARKSRIIPYINGPLFTHAKTEMSAMQDIHERPERLTEIDSPHSRFAFGSENVSNSP